MGKTYVVTGAIIGAVGVLLGAMGAHLLAQILPEKSLMSFRTGTSYQMYHALLFLISGALLPYLKGSFHRIIYFTLLTGILFFSGSIYLLSIGKMIGLDLAYLGPITPIGGILLISSWILIAIAAIMKEKN